MQQDGKKGEAAYIMLSFFRSNVYSELTPSFCRLDVYDENIYDDGQACFVYVDFGWVKDCILEFDKDVRGELKKSSTKLPGYRIDSLVLGEVVHFADAVNHVLRHAIPDIEQLSGWQHLKMYDFVDIRFGEYWGDTRSVYKYDLRAVDELVLRDKLQEKDSMHYYSVKNARLSGGDYSNADLRYSDFSGSNFENSSFANANLTGTSWRNCNLKNVNFSGANLIGADFRGAVTDAAVFDGAVVLDIFGEMDGGVL